MIVLLLLLLFLPEVQFELVPIKGSTGQPNVLGIVVFSVLFGVMLGRMGERGRPIMEFCQCIVEVTMKLFTIFLWWVISLESLYPGSAREIIFDYLKEIGMIYKV